MNNFKKNIEANKKEIEIVKATEAAKEIKQYGGIDAYNLMKKGDMYAVTFEGRVIGGATSKKDAEAAIELLRHCTGGAPLTAENLNSAMWKAQSIITTGNNLVEAEADGTIKIDKTLVFKDKEYIIDDTNELYTIDGEHICNVADIYAALESKALTQELFDEILGKRIAEYWDAKKPEPVDTGCGCKKCCYDETTVTQLNSKHVTYNELNCGRDCSDEDIEDCITDWLYENYCGDIDELHWYRAGDGVNIDATMIDY